MKYAVVFLVLFSPFSLAYEVATLQEAQAKGTSLALGEGIGCVLQAEANAEITGRCFTRNYWSPAWENPPTLVPPVRILAPSNTAACALDATGVKCWGRQALRNPPPLKAPYLLAADGRIACAVDDAGLQCWGDDTWTGVIPQASERSGTVYYKTVKLPAGQRATFLKLGPYDYVMGLNDGTLQMGGHHLPELKTFFSGSGYGSGDVALSFYWLCKKTPLALECHHQYSSGERVSIPVAPSFQSFALGLKNICLLQRDAVECHSSETPFGEVKSLPTFQQPSLLAAGYGSTCVKDSTGIVCTGALSGQLVDGSLGPGEPTSPKFSAGRVAVVSKSPPNPKSSAPVVSPTPERPTKFEDL